jgi:hypothetical protein
MHLLHRNATHPAFRLDHRRGVQSRLVGLGSAVDTSGGKEDGDSKNHAEVGDSIADACSA